MTDVVGGRYDYARTAVCRRCGDRFELNRRAGRNSERRGLGSAPAKSRTARYCSDRCRKAASRDRISRDRDRVKTAAGTIPLSGVTAPEITSTNQWAAKAKITTLDPLQRAQQQSNHRILGPARVL